MSTADQNLPADLVGRRLQRRRHDAMACTWELVLVEDDRDYADQIAAAAFAEVDRLEAELSRFRPGSDIARLNVQPVGQPLKISHETLECLQIAERIRQQTGGAFNVAWQPDRPTPTETIVLDPADHSATRLSADIRLDLGGIGKGYALDQLAALIRDWGVTDALLSAGQSTVLAIRDANAPPDAGWPLRLRDRPDLPMLRLRNAALAGSGQILHGDHIVDPQRGEPASPDRAAWALAQDAARADALSTAFMVMPIAAIDTLCRRHASIGGVVRENETVQTYGACRNLTATQSRENQ